MKKTRFTNINLIILIPYYRETNSFHYTLWYSEKECKQFLQEYRILLDDLMLRHQIDLPSAKRLINSPTIAYNPDNFD